MSQAAGRDKDKKKKIVIVKKKKNAHGGHHGGSWKVAYADFVTAMMAFFMVLWIIGLNDQTKKAIEGYFQNPVGYKDLASAGQTPLAANPGQLQMSPANQLALRKAEEARFKQIAERLRREVAKNPELTKYGAKVEITVGKDGLRIELIDEGTGDAFFPLGSAVMKPTGVRALHVVGRQLIELPHALTLEGHTDAAPMGSVGARAGYTNWELSSDRANAARRVLEESGIAPMRVSEVRGYADRSLRYPKEPRKPGNRRISILVPYSTGLDAAAIDSIVRALAGSGDGLPPTGAPAGTPAPTQPGAPAP